MCQCFHNDDHYLIIVHNCYSLLPSAASRTVVKYDPPTKTTYMIYYGNPIGEKEILCKILTEENIQQGNIRFVKMTWNIKEFEI